MMNRSNVAEDTPPFISQMWFRYAPYWPLFFLLFVLAIGSGLLFMKYAKHYFEINARLLIKDESKGEVNAKALESLDVFGGKKIIENEIEVVKSRSLLSKVIEELHLYASVMTKERFADRSAYPTSPLKIEALFLDQIRSTEEIPFRIDRKAGVVSIGPDDYPFDSWQNTPWGILKFKPAGLSDNKRSGSSMYFVLTEPKKVINSIKGRLSVKSSSRSSSIIELTFEDEVPARGKDIVNTLMRFYNETVINDKNNLATSTLQFVEKRLEMVGHELDSIENKIQQYRHKWGVIDISVQGKLFLESVSAIDRRLSEVNTQLAVLKQVDDFISTQDKSNSIVPSTLGVTDPVLSQLVDKLYTAELEYEGLKKTTAENNPMLSSISDQIAMIKPSIVENIESQRRSLMASRENLLSTSNSYTSMLRSLPQTEKRLIEINRQQKIKSEIYNFLLQKREETAFAHASVGSESRIIDSAYSSESPVSPKPKIVYLFSTFLALLAGAAIVAIRENLNNNILFRHEIEQSTHTPIIGEIAYDNSKSTVVIEKERKSFIAEQIRSLRTSLAFLGVDHRRKRLMITSSISGEGKSFIAVNLAVGLALTNKRVILLDLDLNMNGPTINQKLNLEAHEGVTEYLENEANLKDIILKTDLADSLYLISKGKLPNNPTELLLNGRLQQLFSDLDELFDYIVIDTPPVALVTDAYLVSPFCDSTLFVVRHGYTPKILVQRIDENKKINALNNMAIVFNGVHARGFGSKKYGYGYGYGYVQKDSRKWNLQRLKA
jgi:tyrosine-protein kinase Etk/Wzc